MSLPVSNCTAPRLQEARHSSDQNGSPTVDSFSYLRTEHGVNSMATVLIDRAEGNRTWLISDEFETRGHPFEPNEVDELFVSQHYPGTRSQVGLPHLNLDRLPTYDSDVTALMAGELSAIDSLVNRLQRRVASCDLSLPSHRSFLRQAVDFCEQVDLLRQRADKLRDLAEPDRPQTGGAALVSGTTATGQSKNSNGQVLGSPWRFTTKCKAILAGMFT